MLYLFKLQQTILKEGKTGNTIPVTRSSSTTAGPLYTYLVLLRERLVKRNLSTFKPENKMDLK